MLIRHDIKQQEEKKRRVSVAAVAPAATSAAVPGATTMLSNGADDDAEDSEDSGWGSCRDGPQSPMVLAMEKLEGARLQSVVELLLERQAYRGNILGTDTNGNTALHYASRMGHTQTVETILNLLFRQHNGGGGDAARAVDVRNAHQSTPLHLCARNGHALTVHALLDAGADNEAVDMFGQRPIDLARKHGHGEIEQFLRRI